MKTIQNSTMTALRVLLVVSVSLLIAVSAAWSREPSGMPDQDYTIWGTACVDGVALTRDDAGYTVSLRLDGEEADLVSYTMGSEPASGDWYVLRIPMSIGASPETAQTGDIAHIYINSVLISEAYLEPTHQLISLPITIGNPAEAIRMSVYQATGGEPPVASDPLITPENPKTVHDLAGSYTYYDEDQNPESGLTEIRWYKDGQPQATHDDTLIVPHSTTTKEQAWYFTVKPHDGYQFGAMQTSTPVTIGNSRPEASDPSISPASPRTGDDLAASYNYADPDGDPETDTTIRWYKNDNIQSAYNDVEIVPSSATAKGQDWRFTVRPGDGIELGPYQTSPTVTIDNTPPVADSGGPYEVQPGEEVIFDGSGSFDADDDPLVTYSWDFGDDNAGTGENPSHLYAMPGMYLVTLVVNDGTVDSAPSITTAYIDNDPGGAPSAPFELAAGWNLISIPKQPSDTSIDVVLFPIQGKYDSISIYNAATGAWLRYIVGAPLFLNTLNEVTSGVGYWVKMNQPGVMVVQGAQPATKIWLETGWNLVGYGSQTSKAIENCMASIDGQFNSVWTYDSDEGKWLRYTPNGSPSLNDLEFMQPGKGYLIDAKEPCVWDVLGQ